MLTLEMDTCLTRKENSGVSPTQNHRVRGERRMGTLHCLWNYPQDSIPLQSQHRAQLCCTAGCSEHCKWGQPPSFFYIHEESVAKTLQSMERLQGWVLLHEAVQNKSQLLSNLLNLREFSLAALHQTSSKGWRQWMEGIKWMEWFKTSRDS